MAKEENIHELLLLRENVTEDAKTKNTRGTVTVGDIKMYKTRFQSSDLIVHRREDENCFIN